MGSRQLPLFEDEGTRPTLRELAETVLSDGVEHLPQAVLRADAARYQEVRVRSALTSVRGMPFGWALNPYRGCTHACEYCYARKYQRHLELGADDFSTLIIVKHNLPAVLEREVRRASWAREVVAVGTATDPYQPIEGQYRLTRRCLEVLTEADTPFSVVTKGPMVVRDRDVLKRASRRAGAKVYLSVPTVDDEGWRRLEPGTASPAQRLHAARMLRDEGITTGILMMPLVPGITTSPGQIERTVKAVEATGVPLVGASLARLDPGVREFFFSFLAREYPELVGEYGRIYQGTRPEYAYGRAVLAMVEAERRQTGGRS